MARIETYPSDSALVGDEKLIGSDSDDSTKNYPLNSLALSFGVGGAANNPVALTSVAGVVDWLGDEGTIYELNLTENTTINFPSALTNHKIIRIKVKQGATPWNFTLSFVGPYKFEGGLAPVQSTGEFSGFDVYTFLSDGSDMVLINKATELAYAVL